MLSSPRGRGAGMIGCGLAGSFGQLLAWRWVTGLGSALQMAGAQLFLTDISASSNRARTLGTNQARCHTLSAPLTVATLGSHACKREADALLALLVTQPSCQASHAVVAMLHASLKLGRVREQQVQQVHACMCTRRRLRCWAAWWGRAVESAPPLKATASGNAGAKACRAASKWRVMVNRNGLEKTTPAGRKARGRAKVAVRPVAYLLSAFTSL